MHGEQRFLVHQQRKLLAESWTVDYDLANMIFADRVRYAAVLVVFVSNNLGDSAGP